MYPKLTTDPFILMMGGFGYISNNAGSDYLINDGLKPSQGGKDELDTANYLGNKINFGHLFLGVQ